MTTSKLLWSVKRLYIASFCIYEIHNVEISKIKIVTVTSFNFREVK